MNLEVKNILNIAKISHSQILNEIYLIQRVEQLAWLTVWVTVLSIPHPIGWQRFALTVVSIFGSVLLQLLLILIVLWQGADLVYTINCFSHRFLTNGKQKKNYPRLKKLLAFITIKNIPFRMVKFNFLLIVVS